MIIFDSSNFRSGSNVPQVDGCVISDILEDITGADCMVSPLDMPAGKPALIREHISNRALLIQLKIGADFPASLGNRLYMSFAKMKEAGASAQQRWLLTQGVYTEGDGGELLVNGVKTSKLIPGQRYMYSASVTASRNWQLRGGGYWNCYNADKLVEWIKLTEEYLDSKHPEVINAMPDMPIVTVEDNDPFQTVKRAPRGLIILSYLLGEQTGLEVWNKCDQSLMWALDYLTDTNPKRLIGLVVGGKKVNEPNLKKKAISILGGLPGHKLEVVTQAEADKGNY